MGNYDVIGDIHGSADKLRGLLRTLGYRGDIPTHPDGRRVIFVGDLIDRGTPEDQLDVVFLVRDMVRAKSALAVMGNHEFNALAYATPLADGSSHYCRSHDDEHNNSSHRNFLAIADDDRQACLEFFRSLPLWLDLDGLRVIHACWDNDARARVERELGGSTLRSDDDIRRASDRTHQLFSDIETLLKGPEIHLQPISKGRFLDRGGKPRSHARLRWWRRDPGNLLDFVEIGDLEQLPPQFDIDAVRREPFSNHASYTDPIPVVFGHYWRRLDSHGHPHDDDTVTEFTACVDFSAIGGGPLVAYRFTDGETRIVPDNFVVYSPETPSSSSKAAPATT